LFAKFRPLFLERTLLFPMFSYLAVVISSLIYGIEPNLHNIALGTGLLPSQTNPVRVISGIIILLLICTVRRCSLRADPRTAFGWIVVGFFGNGLTHLLLASAYRHLSVGTTTVIHFLFPTLVCAVTAMLNRRKLLGAELVAMVLSVAGLICIGGSGGGTVIGYLLAIGSAVSFAFYMIGSERLKDSPLSFPVRMFYNLIGTLLMGLFSGLLLGTGGSWTSTMFLLVLLCGALNCSAGFLFQYGILRIGAAIVAFLSLLEPIGSLLVSTLVFGHPLPGIALVGCILMLAAIVCISIGKQKAAPSAAESV